MHVPLYLSGPKKKLHSYIFRRSKRKYVGLAISFQIGQHLRAWALPLKKNEKELEKTETEKQWITFFTMLQPCFVYIF